MGQNGDPDDCVRFGYLWGLNGGEHGALFFSLFDSDIIFSPTGVAASTGFGSASSRGKRAC